MDLKKAKRDLTALSDLFGKCIEEYKLLSVSQSNHKVLHVSDVRIFGLQTTVLERKDNDFPYEFSVKLGDLTIFHIGRKEETKKKDEIEDAVLDKEKEE